MFDEQFSFIPSKEEKSTEKVGGIRVKTCLESRIGRYYLVEASENFVDLAFSFLTIPLESVLELVLGAKGNPKLGSVSNLFRDLNTLFRVSKQKDSQKGVLPMFYRCTYEFPSIPCRDPPELHYCYTFA
ncbi:hypothetical protein V6N11_084386 [Hibiscus sabdariffa]